MKNKKTTLKTSIVAVFFLAVFASFTTIKAQSDINLSGYTPLFTEDFNSPSWTTASPKGASTWRSSAPVSSKVIGYQIHDQNCMSISNGHLLNKLAFMSGADVTGSRSAGPVGMKDGSGTALIQVQTPGTAIHSRSGMAWGHIGWVGMKFTTPAAGLTVTQLGHYAVTSGTNINNQQHEVRIFDATDGSDVAKTIVNTSGQPANSYVYAPVTSGTVTLQGSHAYYLMSWEYGQDTGHGDDYWYDGNTTVTASGGITVNESEWGNWHAGSLFSVDSTFAGFTQQYGYWEARVKMPASGLGSWPSFCLYTTNQSGLSEEVDIFEDYGNNYDSNTDGGALMRNHNWGGGPTEGSASIEPMASKTWLNYHIYGFQADSQYCIFYLDGVPRARFATPIDYLVAPMYITLEYNTGGGWPITGLVANSAMDVDWVHVWGLPTSQPSITSALTATGTAGSAFNYQIGATYNPTNYNATGLPTGVSVNNLTGLISGTPAATGTFNVGLSASNISGTGSATLVLTVTGTSSGLPAPWTHQDVGSVPAAGTASYSGGTFTVAGSGNITYGTTTDQFQYAYQAVSGDCTITARVVSASPAATKAGVMIRETTSDSSSHKLETAAAGSLLYYARTSTGGSSSKGNQVTNALPYWMRLQRVGNTITSYYSSSGASGTWTTGSVHTITMASNVSVGLAVTSTSSSLGTATFDNVSVTTP